MGKRLLPLVCCLIAPAIGGCASFKKAPTEQIPGITSPTERITQLRNLAAEAPKMDPAGKLRVADQLSQEIQKEQDPLIRAQIVRTLGAYPAPSSDQVLRAAVGDPEADVRTAACESWARRGTPEAAAALAGVLSGDIDRDVRMAAARALGCSRDPAALAALGGALEDNDPAMQYRAVASLRQVAGRELGNDVNRWREYVKSGNAKPDQGTSVAERVHQWFH